MIVPDVNLLLYATVTAFPQHGRAHEWWTQAMATATPIGLATPTVFGFLRIVTNPRVLTPPMGFDMAAGHVREWLARPHVELIAPRSEHVEIALTLLRDVGTAGNLTTDAQLAAIAIEQGAEIRSHDADFGRFTGVSWSDPLA